MNKTIKILFLMMFSALPCFAAWEGELNKWIEPNEVIRCLKTSQTSNLILDTEFNPFYLRGDFDGDKKPDYAIWMRRKAGGIAGIVICAGNSSVHLLGSGITGGKKFSDMDNDDFSPLYWEVATKQETNEMATWKCYVPDPFPKIENESIKLIWREGENTLIYWDGKQYKWTGGFILEPREDCMKTIQN